MSRFVKDEMGEKIKPTIFKKALETVIREMTLEAQTQFVVPNILMDEYYLTSIMSSFDQSSVKKTELEALDHLNFVKENKRSLFKEDQLLELYVLVYMIEHGHCNHPLQHKRSVGVYTFCSVLFSRVKEEGQLRVRLGYQIRLKDRRFGSLLDQMYRINTDRSQSFIDFMNQAPGVEDDPDYGFVPMSVNEICDLKELFGYTVTYKEYDKWSDSEAYNKCPTLYKNRGLDYKKPQENDQSEDVYIQEDDILEVTPYEDYQNNQSEMSFDDFFK